MRNVFLALIMCFSCSGFAQIFKVGSIDKVKIPLSFDAKVAAISPRGDYLLLSTPTNSGLTKLDLRTGEATRLTDAQGAGYDVRISPNGQTVVFRENSFTREHFKRVALRSINLATGKAKQLVAPTRDLQGVSLENAAAATVTKGRMEVKGVDGTKARISTPVLSINNRQLMITRNGKTKIFSPNGTNNSYLWPSVSPDGSKILYYVAGLGTFVCNTDGSNIKKVGTMRAPQWYGDSIVVGMDDRDDGAFIYASTIVAATLEGDVQVLTDSSVVAMYPKVSNSTGQIAFSTPGGEAYIINVTKK